MTQSWYGSSTIWGLPSFTPDVWAAPKDTKVVQPDSFWKSESASWSPLLGLSSPPLSPLPPAEPLLDSPLPSKHEPPSALREPQAPLFVPVTGLAGWNSASQQQQQQQQHAEDIEQQLNKQCLYKTELCRSFEETGKCRYASKCQFAHGRAELRPVLRHPKYKTEICKTYQSNGTCPYGSRCRFIHVPEEAAKTEPATATADPAAAATGAEAPVARQKRTKRRSRRAAPATPPQAADAPLAHRTPEPETKSRLSIFKQLVPLD